MKTTWLSIWMLLAGLLDAQTRDTSGWKNFRDNIREQTSLIAQDPSAGHYYERGVYKDLLGDERGALKDFDKAIELKPDYADAYYERGVIRNLLYDLKESIADLSKAISLNPFKASYYAYRARTWSDLEETRKAIADYDKAIELDPTDALVYCDRAEARSKIHDDKGALQDFDRSISLDPRNAYAYDQRAELKHRLGDTEGAVKDNNTVIIIEPEDSLYYTRPYSKQHYVQGSRQEYIEFTDFKSEGWTAAMKPYQDEDITYEAYKTPGNTANDTLRCIAYKQTLINLDTLMNHYIKIDHRYGALTQATLISRHEKALFPDIIFMLRFLDKNGTTTVTELYYGVMGQKFTFNTIYMCTGELSGKKLKKRIEFFTNHQIAYRIP